MAKRRPKKAEAGRAENAGHPSADQPLGSVSAEEDSTAPSALPGSDEQQPKPVEGGGGTELESVEGTVESEHGASAEEPTEQASTADAPRGDAPLASSPVEDPRLESFPPAQPWDGFDEEDWDRDDAWEARRKRQRDELSKIRARPSGRRLFFRALVVFVGIYVISSFSEELAYFFSSDEPIDLGNALEYVLFTGEDGQLRRERILDAPHNVYAKVRGLPIHPAVAGTETSAFRVRTSKNEERVIYQLEGSRIFAEEAMMGSQLEKWFAASRDESGQVMVETIDLQGRLLSFAEDDEGIYRGLRDYYRDKYGMAFCVDMSKAELEKARAELGRGG
ncbi:MAG: hypothetical protein RBU37_25650, partial [Myxococcota bacterium]|nr:hypothetical protein [Myxococcota bacterium]